MSWVSLSNGLLWKKLSKPLEVFRPVDVVVLASYWLSFRLESLRGMMGMFICGVVLRPGSSVLVGLALTYSIEVTLYLRHGMRAVATIEQSKLK